MTGRAKAGTSKAAAAERRRLFARAYIANGHNATQAAIEAGYSEKGAAVQGARMLKDPKVSEELAAAAERGCQAADITIDRTLQELACIAYSDPRRLFGPDGRMLRLKEVDPETAAALAHVVLDDDGRITSFRFLDKVTALGMAMKHLGLFEKDNRQPGQSYALQVLLVSADPDAPKTPQPLPMGSDGRLFPRPLDGRDVGQESRAPQQRW